MRAVVLSRHGPAGALRLEDRPDPRPERGQMLVDVAAAGVGFTDVLERAGLYPGRPKLPAVLGHEVAGTVVAGAGPFSPGDRVLAFVPGGGYAERAAVGPGDALPLPDGMSFEEGAAVPLAYATANAALSRYGAARPGERVLVHGAAGGVGSAAVQLARELGLEIWGTASTAKQALLRELGVHHPLDYSRSGWDRELPELDLVMDPRGGASYRRSYGSLRAGGRLVCFGASGVLAGERRNPVRALRTVLATPRFRPLRMLSDSRAVIGLDTISIWRARGSLTELLEPLAPLLASGRIRPTVAQTFPLARAADAHRMLGERRNAGKVVLATGGAAGAGAAAGR